MSADKSDLKALIAEGFAAEFLDSRDKSHRSVALYRGAAEGLSKAKQVINAIAQETRNELVEKGIQFDPSDPIAVGKFVVDRLMLAVRKIHELAENDLTSSIRAEGELKAFESIVNRLADAAQKERAKAIAAREAMLTAARNSGEGDIMLTQTELAHVTTRPGPRIPGTHPGLPVKAQRQAEVAAKGSQTAEHQAQAADEKNDATVKPRRKSAKAKAKKVADAANT